MELGGNFDISLFLDVTDVFRVDFLDSDMCRDFVVRRLHPHGFSCPRCRASVHDSKRVDRLTAGDRVACSSCAKRFSAISGTFLSGTHMDFRVFFMLLWLMREGFQPVRIAHILGMDPTTIRSWVQKLEVV